MNPGVVAPTRDEVLADTRETLRAVARALDFMAPVSGEVSAPGIANPMQHMTRLLAESCSELAEILEGLRQTRDLIRGAEMDHLQNSTAALQDATPRSELATTGMLAGIERCQALLDRLAPAASPEVLPAAPGGDPREALRDELHQIMQHLQFEDVTAQRIGHATGVLAEVGTRLGHLVGMLDSCGISAPVRDPMATTQGAASPQALADDIFS
ncbi:MAG: hypothetical protein EA350_09475 [Gemmatimonadales bacterium]|nr:MAG: hypothetical protein EA350_09475 [Gemmatimonadales bacterium]